MSVEHITIDEPRPEDAAVACEVRCSVADLRVNRAFGTPDMIARRLRPHAVCRDAARHGGRPLGAAAYGHDGRRGSMCQTGVLPEYRRQGIAPRLVQDQLARVRDAGVASAFLFTCKTNRDVQVFWHAIGSEHREWVQHERRDIVPACAYREPAVR